jgi:hypothetical protein
VLSWNITDNSLGWCKLNSSDLRNGKGTERGCLGLKRGKMEGVLFAIWRLDHLRLDKGRSDWSNHWEEGRASEEWLRPL